MEKRQQQFSIGYFILAILIIFGLQTYFAAPPVETLNYSEFKNLVAKGQVSNLVLGEKAIRGEIKPEAVKTAVSPERLKSLGNEFKEGKKALPFVVVRVEDPELVSDLQKSGIAFKGEVTSDWVPTVLSWVVPVVLFFLLWNYLFKRMGSGAGGLMQIGKSKAKVYIEKKTGVTFNDVAGIDEAEEELVEVVEFLKTPQKYQRLGGRIPKGVLLIGPPGTGKTLLARAVAGEAGVPFFSISGSDFVEMFVGVGASRVRDLFEQAKQNSPCIIFMDEIDAVGRHRGAGLGGGHDEREQTLNQLLVEMDGFELKDNIIFIAATNRPDILDPALLRPGRFDRQIVVDRPDRKGRAKILEVHTRGKPLAKVIDIDALAGQTPGFTGADLANLVNEAALNAARYNKKVVAMPDFELAKDKVLMGAERKSMVISNEEKRVTAYHEAGHTLVGLKVPNADPVHKVTIIPRGMALGITQQLPEGDRHNYTQEYLLGQIAILMGGRIAEETFLGSITTGASNDIERATELARAMVCEYGMSELGPLTFGKKEEQIFLGREISQHRDYSEDTAIKIDQEVKKLIGEQYERARRIIEENRDTMVRLAENLLEHESLDGVQIRRIVAGLPLVEDTEEPSTVSSEEQPKVKEPAAKPLKPILPPITGGTPAPA